MRTIIVKLPPRAEVSSEMAKTRGWFDANGCAPSGFKYDLARRAVIFQVVKRNELKPRLGSSRNHFL
jgi:hypothetical protein